jgi:hypothetical protein
VGASNRKPKKWLPPLYFSFVESIFPFAVNQKTSCWLTYEGVNCKNANPFSTDTNDNYFHKNTAFCKRFHPVF